MWPNLSASAPRDKQLGQPTRTLETLEQAVAWADEQGYTEYGNEIDAGPANHNGTDRGLETRALRIETMVEDLRGIMTRLSPDDRLWAWERLRDGYCIHCGSEQPKTGSCQCWNDE